MMHCSYCGSDNQTNKKKCPNCGADSRVPKTVLESQAKPVEPEPSPLTKLARASIAIGTGTFIFYIWPIHVASLIFPFLPISHAGDMGPIEAYFVKLVMLFPAAAALWMAGGISYLIGSAVMSWVLGRDIGALTDSGNRWD